MRPQCAGSGGQDQRQNIGRDVQAGEQSTCLGGTAARAAIPGIDPNPVFAWASRARFSGSGSKRHRDIRQFCETPVPSVRSNAARKELTHAV
jgi:hypothetical protein